MFKPRFIRRQIAGSLHQSVLFMLCVVLALVTLVSLGGFSRSVHSSFLKDARVLNAADIIISSHSPLSQPLVDEVTALERRKAIESARLYEFYSIVRRADGNASLLASIKVAEPGYPFYGRVELASGRGFHEAQSAGTVMVEQALLDRLHLRVGDPVKIGDAVFTVGDVVLAEPDRPVNIFTLGPRVFLPARDLPSLGLIGKGSRVHYTVLAKTADERDLERIAARLRAASQRDRERVETFRTADSRVKRFFDNVLFFLNLIGIFTLLLSGIGIESSVTAFLSEQERTIAVMKALGAGSRFIMKNYFALVLVLGLAGTALGIGASFLLERMLPGLFQGLLPAEVRLSIPFSAVLEGLAVGLAVVALFTLLPLLRLKEVKPRAIFGKDVGGRQERSTWFFTGIVLLFFLGLIFWKIGEVKTGLMFVIGTGLLLLVSFLCATALLRALRKRRIHNLALRQAFKGLFRPRNATRAIIATLTAALAVIFCITIVEKNLDATFVRSFPPDAPNVFFIDIQPSQKSDFAKALGAATTYYPVVRGTVIAVNGERIDREQERRKRGDNLAREFNLTYRDTLLEDERIIKGTGLFRTDQTGPQVSILDTVSGMREMKIGDSITFRIQGVPVDARISSIRTRTEASLQPFFYFVFQESVLRDAPATFFTALRVDRERIAALQNRIVEGFPNVSVIDVTGAVSVFAGIMSRLSTIVNFFTLFSVVAGILIMISSVFATRYSRTQEAVYFTVLGARGRFVLTVFAAENMLIGLAGSLTAMALAQTAGWIICRSVLDVPYQPFAGISIAMVLAATAVVIGVGLGASAPILNQKPAPFLREQTEE